MNAYDDVLTIHVGIGNSDDKLGQRRWHEFVTATRYAITQPTVRLLGEWYSRPDQPYQNAQFAFQADSAMVARIRPLLSRIAGDFGQDSIAWCPGVTEFLTAPDGESR